VFGRELTGVSDAVTGGVRELEVFLGCDERIGEHLRDIDTTHLIYDFSNIRVCLCLISGLWSVFIVSRRVGH